MPTFGIPCPPPDPQIAADVTQGVTDYVNCLVKALLSSVDNVVEGNASLINSIATIQGSPVTQSTIDVQSVIDQLQQTLQASGHAGDTYNINIGSISEDTYNEPTTTNEETVSPNTDQTASDYASATATATLDAEETEDEELDEEEVVLPSGVRVLGEGDKCDDDEQEIVIAGKGKELKICEPAKDAQDAAGAAAKPPDRPPVLPSAFPCPPKPQGWSSAMGVIGTPAWCTAVELLFDWFDKLGDVLERYIKVGANLTWLDVQVRSLFPPDEDKSVFANFQRNIVRILSDAVELAAHGTVWLFSAAQCARYYAAILLPIRRQSSYAAISLVHSVIAMVKGSRVGSQSYMGVTVSTNLTLPQLEEYLLVLLRYLCPMEFPGVAEIGEAWRKEYIDTDQRDCLLNLNGCNPVLWDQFLRAAGEGITPQEAIQWARREGLDFAEQVDTVVSTGVIDRDIAVRMVTLYDELPSIQDHLHWLQRNVFDDEYVEKYKLLEGFEERFYAKFGDDLNALGYTKQRASYEYAAHWVMPSPTQMREFMFRLRPGRVADDKVFTVDDYKRILAEQDYNVVAQQWLADTAYKIPTQQQLKYLYTESVITETDLATGLQDLGYGETDAGVLAGTITLQVRRQRASNVKGWTPSALATAYSAGQITATVVNAQMNFLGYHAIESQTLMDVAKAQYQAKLVTKARARLLTTTVSQVKSALKIGVMDTTTATRTLSAIGWPAAISSSIANLITADANADAVKHAISHLRSTYIHGDVDLAYCRRALTTLGLVPAAIERYLAIWPMENTPHIRRRTASQIVTDVAEGAMTMPQAVVRWTNLGYSSADIALYQEEVGRKIVRISAPIFERRPVTPGSIVNLPHEIGEDTVRVPKSLVASLMKEQPPAQLQKWLKAGVITAGEMTDRLMLYGWDMETIERWVEASKPPPPKDASKKAGG